MNLKINHRLGYVNLEYFNNVDVTLKYDSVASSFVVEFYFDPKNEAHAEMACVSHFHECILQHEGETLITGFILSQQFTKDKVKRLAKIAGYSKPGVLGDCDIPTKVDWQYNGLTLTEITKKIIAPFRLGLVIQGVKAEKLTEKLVAPDQQEEETKEPTFQSPFETTSKVDKKIQRINVRDNKNCLSFLTELALQRGIILSHDRNGNLLFASPNTRKEPIVHIEDGMPGVEIDMTFNGQGIHSHIEVIKQSDVRGGDPIMLPEPLRNPYCPVAYVYRPKVLVQSSGDVNDIEDFARMGLADELRNISFTIKLDRWKINNKLIKPGDMITITSPENYVYKKARLFIEEVNFKGDSKETVATLKCVLPEVYNKEIPRNIFVDRHENSGLQ